jgi:hypothetical protein
VQTHGILHFTFLEGFAFPFLPGLHLSTFFSGPLDLGSLHGHLPQGGRTFVASGGRTDLLPRRVLLGLHLDGLLLAHRAQFLQQLGDVHGGRILLLRGKHGRCRNQASKENGKAGGILADGVGVHGRGDLKR